MKSRLAERLLVKTMDWNPEEISQERPLLQALATFKYDEYQQFSPGIRFIESLVKWLSQFSTVDERRTAYNFVKTQLVFFTNNQIIHLVNITYPEKIHPVIMDKVASGTGINPFWTKKIAESSYYQETLRCSLFIGLSDGARIDQFRRSYSHISNEQVLSTYSIGEDKVEDMITELTKSDAKGKFTTVFLMDDFTASGTSYFRKKDATIWTGKIYKFLDAATAPNTKSNSISNLFDLNTTLDIHVCFYIATEEAIGNLKNNIEEFSKEKDSRFNFKITFHVMQYLGDELKSKVLGNSSMLKIMEDYFDSSIVDSHFEKGKHDKPYLGFNECSLPLVLNHNTPNNSIPLLWFSEDKDLKGLFPRVTRHKDE